MNPQTEKKMKKEATSYLPIIAGLLMFGVFAVNAYIGLKDGNLADYSPLHLELNWLMAAVDVVAGVVLIVARNSIRWVSLSGIVWPAVYFLSLAVDIMTDLCLGGGSCWASPTAAFKYLILGDSGWLLWKYTMLTGITLLVIVVALSLVTVMALRYRSKQVLEKSKSRNPVPK